MYSLEYTKAFEKGIKKLSAIEQRTTAEKLKILVHQPTAEKPARMRNRRNNPDMMCTGLHQ